MALVIKLKPRERLLVNGALIRNASDSVATLHLLNRANVLHEKDILLPEQAGTPLGHLYIALQDLLLAPEQSEQRRAHAIHMAARIYADAVTKRDTDTCNLIGEVIKVVGEDNIYRALRLIKPLIGPPPAATPKTPERPQRTGAKPKSKKT